MTCEKADRDTSHQFIKILMRRALRLNSILRSLPGKIFAQNRFTGRQVIVVQMYMRMHLHAYIEGPKILKTYPEMKVVYLWAIII